MIWQWNYWQRWQFTRTNVFAQVISGAFLSFLCTREKILFVKVTLVKNHLQILFDKVFALCKRRFWAGAFLSVAWPTGVQLLVFFCSSVPVVLFGTPGISGCQSQHVPVESSSLLHHSIYLRFICFPWWSIDELENLHADRTTVCFEPW